MQCVIINEYDSNKCLLLGGRNNSNEEKFNDILQFHFISHKIENSLLKLSEKKSGFGAIVRQNMLYIFGGLSNQVLSSFQ